MNLNTSIKPNIFINNRNDLSNTKANQQSVSFTGKNPLVPLVVLNDSLRPKKLINLNNIKQPSKLEKFCKEAPGKTLEISKKVLNGVGEVAMGILKYGIAKPAKAIWDRKEQLFVTSIMGGMSTGAVLQEINDLKKNFSLLELLLGIVFLSLPVVISIWMGIGMLFYKDDEWFKE